MDQFNSLNESQKLIIHNFKEYLNKPRAIGWANLILSVFNDLKSIGVNPAGTMFSKQKIDGHHMVA